MGWSQVRSRRQPDLDSNPALSLTSLALAFPIESLGFTADTFRVGVLPHRAFKGRGSSAAAGHPALENLTKATSKAFLSSGLLCGEGEHHPPPCFLSPSGLGQTEGCSAGQGTGCLW